MAPKNRKFAATTAPMPNAPTYAQPAMLLGAFGVLPNGGNRRARNPSPPTSPQYNILFDPSRGPTYRARIAVAEYEAAAISPPIIPASRDAVGCDWSAASPFTVNQTPIMTPTASAMRTGVSLSLRMKCPATATVTGAV